VFSFATTSTLEMYSESSVAKPLSLSGGYAGEAAHKRQLETVRFWIDVSEPGGLAPGARGRATAMRVRVMHVFIRRRLLKHPEWEYDAWGMPISIGDATMTLIGGATIPGLALWSAGHQTTIKEIEALLHFWRYIGHLLGVQPDFYPRNFRESVQLTYAYMLSSRSCSVSRPAAACFRRWITPLTGCSAGGAAASMRTRPAGGRLSLSRSRNSAAEPRGQVRR
jgi:hypothetical protein